MGRKARKKANGLGTVVRRGSTWGIRWREAGKRRYQGGFQTEDLALAVLRKITGDLQAGRGGLGPDPRTIPTLADLAKDWLDRRKATHRSWRDDKYRWDGHLNPAVGHLRPSEVNGARIRRFVEDVRAGGLSSTTAGHCVRLLSSLYTDLVERNLSPTNPVKALPRATRRLYRNAADPAQTPFLKRPEDVRRVFLELPEPINVAFAIGSMAGLRTGEVLGLHWSDIDIDGRRIHVSQQVSDGKLGPLKDEESRAVLIQDALTPILRAWKARTGDTAGLVFKPKHPGRGGRKGRPATYMLPSTLWRHLEKALTKCKLPELTWYNATRHTFASQWVLAGGSIEVLSQMMGHADVSTTQRYAHLQPDLFREADYKRIGVDFSRPVGVVLEMPDRGASGHPVGTAIEDASAEAI